MMFTIKNIIGGWPDNFLDVVFKSTKASDISNVMVKIVPLDNSWGKKRNFDKLMFCFKKGYNFGQEVGDKFTKLSKLGFCMDCFTADLLRLSTKKR